MAGNTLTPVSEQELVSCDTTDNGCNGGLMDNAFEWLVSAKGGAIVTEAGYPYVSGGGNVPSCNVPSGDVGATVTGHKDLPHDEDQMAAWMQKHGPISIAVDATTWQTYTGGILDNCDAVQLDHGVLAVGYSSGSSPYWVIKNSWGTSWGESGYIRVAKGSGQCMLDQSPSVPTVGGKPGPTPPPSPTPPTPPPSPTPPSPGGSFTQKVCTDSGCSQGCQANSLPLNACLSIGGGGSALATSCSSSGLSLTLFPVSADCSGLSIPQTQPVDQCGADGQGTYVETTCDSTADAKQGAELKLAQE